MSNISSECAVCHGPIGAEEDAVTCPECGAPYHRACYEKQGQCVFAARHGAGFEYRTEQDTGPDKVAPDGPQAAAPQPEEPRGILCKNCRTVNDKRNIFCEKCGAPLHGEAKGGTVPPGAGAPFGAGAAGFAPTQDLSGTIDDIPKSDWAAYVGPSKESYLPRLSVQAERGGKTSMMISPFFIPQYYFAYRKLWGLAALAFVVQTALAIPSFLVILHQEGWPPLAGFALETLNYMDMIASYVNLVFRFATSLFALYLYRRSAGKKMKALRAQHPDEGEYQAALRSKGGVSAVGVAVFVLLTFAASAVLYAVTGDYLLAYLASAGLV